MKNYTLLCLLILLLIITSCSKSIESVLESKKLENTGVKKEVIKSGSYSITYPNLTKDFELRVHYLGCGGFYIVDQDDGILIDPFFSNQKFIKPPFKKIASNPDAIAYGLKGITDLEKSRGIFISHSHYDHLFDTPSIVKNHIKKDINVYGSTSTRNLLKTVLDSNQLIVITDSINNCIQEGKWIYFKNNFRVLPIRSEHGPHYRLIGPIKLFKGEAKSIKNYKNPTDETRTGKWKEGDTFSFLIDKLESGKPVFRIFIQSSASRPTCGFPPEFILKEKGIDLSMIGAASFKYIKGKNYPWELIDHLKPKQLLICHWEDFFLPYTEEDKRFVRFTNFKKFLYRLDKDYGHKGEKARIPYALPKPTCKITIKSF